MTETSGIEQVPRSWNPENIYGKGKREGYAQRYKLFNADTDSREIINPLQGKRSASTKTNYSDQLDTLHLETRRASKSVATNSCFLQLKCEAVQFDPVVCRLQSEPFVSSIKILDSLEDNEVGTIFETSTLYRLVHYPYKRDPAGFQGNQIRKPFAQLKNGSISLRRVINKKDESDVICILQTGKVFVTGYFNTGVVETFQRSSHDFIDHEINQGWGEWTYLMDTTLCTKVFRDRRLFPNASKQIRQALTEDFTPIFAQCGWEVLRTRSSVALKRKYAVINARGHRRFHVHHPRFYVTYGLQIGKIPSQCKQMATSSQYEFTSDGVAFEETLEGDYEKKRTYIALKERHEGHACQEYIDGFRMLEENAIFSPDFIPSVRAVSDFLKRTSGFQLRPVAGLVSSRDFLANFAFRVFPCTQYVRHHSQPQHTPEPDIIHEFLGHIPLLTNRKFADFSQMLGLASLLASDEAVNKITTLFWFTVEFGLCNEKGGLRAFGAGILSSYGELDNALSDQSEKRPFDPNAAAIQPYNDVGYQPVYFVCERFDTMKQQLAEYIKTLVHPKLWPRYDPITDSLELLNMKQQCLDVLERLSNNISEMKIIVEKLLAFDVHGA
ncbi:tyrosine 3-monooxygenase [Clonorchis sinensis]|uniref:Tyrosine 3-monooxygenase n=1 Tax=Clonorchis sinensis TaxID=79923 RepID=G7YR93_CLOSI|nr:tyrosine 3-monooxygenase [Clonorchis sinensis]